VTLSAPNPNFNETLKSVEENNRFSSDILYFELSLDFIYARRNGS